MNGEIVCSRMNERQTGGDLSFIIDVEKSPAKIDFIRAVGIAYLG